jgi:hypothetical protein
MLMSFQVRWWGRRRLHSVVSGQMLGQVKIPSSTVGSGQVVHGAGRDSTEKFSCCFRPGSGAGGDLKLSCCFRPDGGVGGDLKLSCCSRPGSGVCGDSKVVLLFQAR